MSVKFDDAARVALQSLQSEMESTRKEIIVHTQFRRATAMAPASQDGASPTPSTSAGSSRPPSCVASATPTRSTVVPARNSPGASAISLLQESWQDEILLAPKGHE